ncbi:MAG TPA: pyruvate kinase [Clostridiales bacterium]|nr:pyruvate kinase [Clostridiales bacterium]
MERFDRVSTGLKGLDQVIDHLRLGDNVVWKVESAIEYKRMVDPFVAQARLDQRNIIYVRFGCHAPLIESASDVKRYPVDAQKGFESFGSEIYELVKKEGRKAFYVFDCLTDLLPYWHSDVMISNFFRVTCPYLYELDTVAYFCIRRNVHTFTTIAGIRETTQLLLDLYQIDGLSYVHPLKVWQRYSPTMFFPHRIIGQETACITGSSEVAGLFSQIRRSNERQDYWNTIFYQAQETLKNSREDKVIIKRQLMQMLIGPSSRLFDLCDRYFDLEDVLAISSREIGTGFIGGKSVGMLAARKILAKDGSSRLSGFLEPHDSYFLGSDVFYTYIVQNGWWRLRTSQKTPDGYFRLAPELKVKLLQGKFPKDIEEQFVQMLEYFGQSPIIVRSSSLLEDNFGNAFAGKYESVFCANQGTPEERFEAFEQAVRQVYASTMNEDALAYRMNRGLFQQDEQMAILVQRVSGDQHDGYFFPHAAGVGNSSNLYVWDKNIDLNSGMLRLVFGLGTRAVNRADGDFARIVCLDNPLREAPVNYEDLGKYTQHRADVISLQENRFIEKELDELVRSGIKADLSLFASPDSQAENRLRELGYGNRNAPRIYNFRKMLRETEFPAVMKDILALLAKAYDYPVDIEFTVNFSNDRQFRINLLQCRPLQTRSLGQPVAMPDISATTACLFTSVGNFMGGNVKIPIDYVVLVHSMNYLKLSEKEKYTIARIVGTINTALKKQQVLLIGPGRWGTTTPSLGVPVHFSEISSMAVIGEVASAAAGFMPELSYGSHFFQELVEAGIFYVALFVGQASVAFNPDRMIQMENLLPSISPSGAPYADVIHVAKPDGMYLFSDIVSQRVLCVENYQPDQRRQPIGQGAES